MANWGSSGSGAGANSLLARSAKEYTNKKAHIYGPAKLKGTTVCASDLRAGAALIIAGLIAEGTTVIENIEHILRGYEDIVEKLKAIGADIELIDE